MGTVKDEFLNKLKVQVHKIKADNRLSLYGQPLQSGGKYGFGFFIIDAGFKNKENTDFYNGIYEFSDEYIPEPTAAELTPQPILDEAWLQCTYPGCTFHTKFPMALVGHQRSHPDMAKDKKDALKGFERKRGPKPKAKIAGIDHILEDEQVMV